MLEDLSLNETYMDKKAFIVKDGQNARIDSWLSQEMGDGFSRSRIKSLIEAGAVCVDGIKVLECKKKVSDGARIEIRLPEPEAAEPEAENIPIDVIYEDDDVIVVNKPAGLVVHPGAGNGQGTLVNALLYHCGTSLSGIGGVKRPGIVHRLDKDTSGVMVVAKHDQAHQALSAQFADHGRTGKLERAYLALHWGAPNPTKGTIDTYLGRSSDRLKRAVTAPNAADAKHAITHYKVIEKFQAREDGSALCALTECRLETGRTHQIRVHMAHIRHPLLGDITYGAAFKSKINRLSNRAQIWVNALNRQALHAYLLQFEHPTSGNIMRFETEMPHDMVTLIDSLKGE